VAPAPIVQIMHRKSLEVIRIRQDPRTGMEVSETSQSILLNYCFGHKNSSLLFFPYVSGDTILYALHVVFLLSRP
jgi:hypothetical protein